MVFENRIWLTIFQMHRYMSLPFVHPVDDMKKQGRASKDSLSDLATEESESVPD